MRRACPVQILTAFLCWALAWPLAALEPDLVLRHDEDVFSAAFSPDGRRIVTGSYATARVWDAVTGGEFTPLTGHEKRYVLSAAFSPDGRRILTASIDQTARIWDAATGAEITRLTGHGNAVWRSAFSPDGRRIVTASDDKTARIWDAATGAEITRLTGHGNRVQSAAFSPDGRRIATASGDKTARIWDAATGAEITRLTGHTHWVASAAFSPDGRRIVTGSWDGTARIWDAATGAEITRLTGHTDYVQNAAFSPDGRRILTGSDDKTARIWDAATGAEITRLTGHESFVWSAAFSADGRRIVTGSEDHTARIWTLPKELWPEEPAPVAEIIGSAPKSESSSIKVLPRPNAMALIIGNKEYRGDIPDVDYALKDARAMRDVLIQRLGVPKRQVRVMENLSRTDFEILFGYKDGTPGDLPLLVPPRIEELYVFYSGHGLPGPGEDGGEASYLLPVDGRTSRVKQTGYPLDLLLRNISKLPVARVHVFLDACFSGQSAGGTLFPNTSLGYARNAAEPESFANVHVLSATGFGRGSEVQLAHWLEDEEHGAFTWHLMQGLKGAANADGDGALTLAELHAYVDAELRLEAFSGRIGTQVPGLKRPDGSDPDLVSYAN